MRPPEYQFPIDPKRVRRLILRVGLVILLLIALFQSISFYVESLWFDSLGYESVFWYRLRAEALTFLVFAAASAGLLCLLFRLLMREKSGGRRVQFGREVLIVPSLDSLKGLALPIAILLGVFFGLSYSLDWNKYAMFFNRPPSGGVADPIFGRPLTFYFFNLPLLESLSGW